MIARYLAMLLSFAAPGGVADRSNTTDIVVIAPRVGEARDRLAKCVARNCPPTEEIDAALALAEIQFEAGDYLGARLTVRRTIGRNGRYASTYPIPVSDLHRSLARIASHMGEEREARQSALRISETLKKGLGNNDPRVFGARFEYVNALLAMGDPSAMRQLEAIEREARRAGRRDIVARAQLRQLWIEYLASPRGSAKDRLARLARSSRPEDGIVSVGAATMLAAIHRREGDNRAAEALIATIGPVRGSKRVLLFEPPYKLTFQVPYYQRREEVFTEQLNHPDVTDRSWIDVAFWVEGNGSVRDVEVVRSGESYEWANPLLEAIKGRRYSASADGEESYRLERYTYTAPLMARTGTHLRQRSPFGRVEYLDLTQDRSGGGASTL